jgi:hypothetical protein
VLSSGPGSTPCERPDFPGQPVQHSLFGHRHVLSAFENRPSFRGRFPARLILGYALDLTEERFPRLPELRQNGLPFLLVHLASIGQPVVPVYPS